MIWTFELNGWDYVGALILALFGSTIGLYSVYNHLTHYENPLLQRNIVRILGICPVYGLCSALSLFGLHSAGFFRDIYEALAIYCFLAFVIDLAGGELACANAIQEDPGTVRQPFPFNHILAAAAKVCPWALQSSIWRHERIPLTPAFLRGCKRSTLQFVIMKPVMGALGYFVFSPYRSYDSRHSPVDVGSGSGNKTSFLQVCGGVWESVDLVVYNVSYSIALYALMLLYSATKSIPPVARSRPLPKFLCVKMIVFASYWQSLLILLLLPTSSSSTHAVDASMEASAAAFERRRQLRVWCDFLLMCETPLAALLQTWAFPVHEFACKKSGPDAKTLILAGALNSGVDVEMQNTGSRGSVEGWMEGGTNVREAIDTVNKASVQIQVVSPPEGNQGVKEDDGKDRAKRVVQTPPLFPSQRDEGEAEKEQERKENEKEKENELKGKGEQQGSERASFTKVMNIQKSIRSVKDKKKRKMALQNATDVFRAKDILNDNVYSFSKKYKRHVLMSNDKDEE